MGISIHPDAKLDIRSTADQNAAWTRANGAWRVFVYVFPKRIPRYSEVVQFFERQFNAKRDTFNKIQRANGDFIEVAQDAEGNAERVSIWMKRGRPTPSIHENSGNVRH